MSASLEETARRLIHTAKSGDDPSYVCIAVAGGGGHAISTLASSPGASSLFLEGSITYDRASFDAYVGRQLDDNFKYASHEAAALLSRAALRKALQYRPRVAEDYPRCIGIGCSSALVSAQAKKGGSRGWIVATRADGTQWSAKLKLSADKQRSRKEEDVIMSEAVLQSIELLRQSDSNQLTNGDNEDHASLNLEDGILSEEEVSKPLVRIDPVHDGAERILSGKCDAVLLLPIPASRKFMAVADPVLPLQSLVFPGSYNPPHHGHTTLAHAASQAWEGSSHAVFLELSLTNPDKPSMDPKDVSERAYKFFDLQEDLPKEWGILLTSAPLFAQKVGVLRPYMSQIVQGRRGSAPPQLGFVIGTDTMVRILSPKYYGNDVDNMLEAVREMGRSGVHFVVGGRLEQRKDAGHDISRFVSGVDEIRQLPADIQAMFTVVKEEDFRVDISSSEIRRQASFEIQEK